MVEKKTGKKNMISKSVKVHSPSLHKELKSSSGKLKESKSPSFRRKDSKWSLRLFRSIVCHIAQEASPEKQVDALQAIESMRSKERKKTDFISNSLAKEFIYDTLTEIFIQALKAPSEGSERFNVARTDKSGINEGNIFVKEKFVTNPKTKNKKQVCNVLKSGTLTLNQRLILIDFSKELGIKYSKTVSDAVSDSDICKKLHSKLGCVLNKN